MVPIQTIRIFLLIFTVLLLTSCASDRTVGGQDSQVVFNPDFTYEPGKAVALLPFANAGRNGFNYIVTDRFAANLRLAGFSVLDRATVEQAAAKAKISLMKTLSREQLAKLGENLGVRVVVKGSCMYSQGATSEGEEALTMISARFLDTVSGETLIYANTQPDGIVPVTRTLAQAIRSNALNDLFRKGNASYNQKNYADAIARFSTLIAMEPTLIEAYRNRGAAYSKAGANTKALADYDRAIALLEEEKAPASGGGRPDSQAAKQSERGKLLFNRGIVLLKSGKPEAAISDFSKALEAGYDPATIHANLGYARFKMKEINNSLIEYGKAIKAKPNWAEIYYLRGLVLEEVNVRDAVKDFSKAISLDSRFSPAYAARGRANLRLGYKDDALKDYSKAIELEPGNAEYKTGRGAALFKMEDYEGAIKEYSSVIEANPTDYEAYLGRAVSYAAKGDDADAAQDFDKVLSSGAPLSSVAYMEAANFQEKQGRYREAIDNFSKAIETSGKDGVAYSNRGKVLQKMGGYRDSVLDFSRSLELRADNPQDYFNRGYSRMQSGGYPQAIDDFNKAASLDRCYAPIYSNRGYAYQNSGNYSQAINDYSCALSLKPAKSESSYRQRYPDPKLSEVNEEFHPFFIHYNRGLSYLAAGNYRPAIEDFSTAIELNPQSAEAFAKRGLANQQVGEMERASADYNHAIELDGRLADAYFGRGSLREQSGNSSAAIADYTKAIDIRPDFADAYFSRGLLRMQMNLVGPGMTDIKGAARMNLQQAKDYLLTRGADW